MSEPPTHRWTGSLLVLLLTAVPVMVSAAPRGESPASLPSMKQLRVEERTLQRQIKEEKRLLREESLVANPTAGQPSLTAPRPMVPANAHTTTPDKQALARRIATEARQLQMEQQSRRYEVELQNSWVREIRAKIQKNWTIPKGYQPGQSCQVTATQDRRGYLVRLQIVRCAANGQFERSVAQAIAHAEPFPLAPNSHVFQATLNFTFKPNIP